MPAADNNRLLQAIAGDRMALAELLVDSAPGIRMTLEGAIPARWQSMLSIEDVLQQTFMDAFLGIRTFVPRGDGSFQAWLTRLAQRNLVDALRVLAAEKRGGKAQPVSPPNWSESCTSLYDWLTHVSQTPSRQVMKAEAISAVESAIQLLPEVYRQVVQLYDLEGRSVEDVAAAIQRSCGAVFMLRARAHDRLKTLMGGESPEASRRA